MKGVADVAKQGITGNNVQERIQKQDMAQERRHFARESRSSGLVEIIQEGKVALYNNESKLLESSIKESTAWYNIIDLNGQIIKSK